MRKICIATVIFLSLLFVLFLFEQNAFDSVINWFNNRNIEEIDMEEWNRMMSLVEKNWFGADMRFEYLVFVDGEEMRTTGTGFPNWLLNPHHRWHDPFYTDLVFVHTEAEATGFPENVIVAWPGDEWRTDFILSNIHRAVNRSAEDLMFHGRQTRPVLTLEEFGLTYPLTRADLVDNWEKVNALWNALTEAERS